MPKRRVRSAKPRRIIACIAAAAACTAVDGNTAPKETLATLIVYPATPATSFGGAAEGVLAYHEIACLSSPAVRRSRERSSEAPLDRRSCCCSVSEALRFECVAAESESVASWALSYCHDNLARLPQIPFGSSRSHGEHESDTDGVSFLRSNQTTAVAEYSLLIPSNSLSCRLPSKPSAWIPDVDDDTSVGRWIDLPNEHLPWKIHSPTVLTSLSPAESSAEHYSTDGVPSTRPVSVRSSLSPYGGMHRTYHHEITFALPEDTHAKNWEVTIYMALYISDAVFMDLDDPQEGPATSDHRLDAVEVRYHADEVIDIEQPAFASSPHVVLAEITVNGTNDMRAEHTKRPDTQRRVEFQSKVHLRYPKPSNSNKGQSRRRDMVLHSPRIVFGTLQLSDRSDVRYAYLLEDTRTTSTTDTMSAATGDEAHYAWVVIWTFGSAIIGAGAMLNDILSACRWTF